MENKLFETETPENRVRMLEDNCEKTESLEMKVPFSNEEKSDMRMELANNLTEIITEDEKLKKAKDLHKEAVKPKKETVKVLTKNLRNGYVKEEQTVYLFADQEAGRMGYYDSNGDLVSSRKLLPTEKQTSLLNINKKTA